VIYLFPHSKTDTFLSTARVSAPTLPPGAVKAFVGQAYIFSEDLDSANPATGCTDGCDLAIDRSLGDSFFQFSFVDARGVGVAKGQIQLLAVPR
jgi:hypothetical protein